MKPLAALVIITVAFTSLPAANSQATEPFIRIDTSTLTFLNVPAGARSLAMGRIGVADNSDPLNQFYNPAILMSADGAGVSQGELNWALRSNFNDYSVYTGRRVYSSGELDIRVGGGVRYTQFDLTIPLPRTIFLPQGTGRAFDTRDSHVTVALASGVSTRLFDAGIGFATRRIKSEIDTREVDAWAFDVGFITKLKLEHSSGVRFYPSVGVSILNLGEDVDYGTRTADLPRQVRPGVGLRVEAPRVDFVGRQVPMAALTTLGEYVSDPQGSDESGFGLETSILEALHLRWGAFNITGDDYPALDHYGVGVAVPVWMMKLTVDYAHLKPIARFDEVDAWGMGITYSF